MNSLRRAYEEAERLSKRVRDLMEHVNMLPANDDDANLALGDADTDLDHAAVLLADVAQNLRRLSRGAP